MLVAICCLIVSMDAIRRIRKSEKLAGVANSQELNRFFAVRKITSNQDL